MDITLISALTRDHIIGSKSGGIPWDIPRDKAHFRVYTANKPILLGRTTFEEMRGWFTTQHPIIVLTNRPKYTPHTPATILTSLPDAIALTKSQNHPELVIAGGSAIFHAALPFATKLVLTWIESDLPPPPNPVRFPTFDPVQFPLIESHPFPPDDSTPYPLTLENRSRP